jgi:MoaA/NifB/PqqE/SkfB family radical SAM enzyme
MQEFSSASRAKMNRRWKKALHRLKHLPRGLDFFRYSLNKLHAYYLRRVKSTKVAHPSSIMIEVTNHCNLKCITCPREYAFGEQMDKGSIPLERLKKIVDQAYPYVDSIGLTGLGETMLYKPLVEAVDYIKSKNKGIVISISINAHLPKSVEIAKRLIGKINTIQISIDGLHEVYDMVRLEGDYSFFIKNVQEMAEMAQAASGITDLMLNMVVIKQNYHQMADIVNIARDIGIKYVDLQTMNLASVPTWDIGFYEMYDTRDFKLALKAAREAAASSGVVLSTFDFEKPNNFQKCLLPWGHFYVSWDGWMTPCCAKPFPKILNFGNVFDDGLMGTLNTPKYRQFRAQWLNNETPDFCHRCHMIDLPQMDMDV